MLAADNGNLLAVSHAFSATHGHVAMVSLHPSASARASADIVCIVDLSGSMDAEATLSGESSAREATGLTVLDVVKHAVITVISSLKPTDRLAIVSFSDDAELEFELTRMTDVEQDKAIEVVKKLRTKGSTNIWSGVEKAMDCLEKATVDGNGRVTGAFLFTDGQPNSSPKEGEVQALKTLKESKYAGRLPAILNTFGFGYNIYSELLSDLAQVGLGSFGFIPDASFVGTIFVDATSNILASASKNVTVSIQPLNGTKIGSAEALISIASLQSGQRRDFIIPVTQVPTDSSAPLLRVELSHTPLGASAVGIKKAATEVVELSQSFVEWDDDIIANQHRTSAASTILSAAVLAGAQDYTGAEKLIIDLIGDIKSDLESLNEENRTAMLALLTDLEGQVLLALSHTHYQKWGGAYLRSLSTAHANQQCNNFKDPGVQLYGGKLFSELRDEISELFLSLPPPVPSTRYGRHVGQPVNMTRFHNASAGCFSVNALVAMADGSTAPAGSIRRGMLLQTPTGDSSVMAVLRSHGRRRPMMRLATGLLITLYHPIRTEYGWQFPINEPNASQCVTDEDVVTLLMSDRNPVVVVDGVEVATLAHGLAESVVAHEFFGTERVVDAMRVLPGWDGEDGVVFCEGVVRGVDGLVAGFVDSGAVSTLSVELGAVGVPVLPAHISVF